MPSKMSYVRRKWKAITPWPICPSIPCYTKGSRSLWHIVQKWDVMGVGDIDIFSNTALYCVWTPMGFSSGSFSSFSLYFIGITRLVSGVITQGARHTPDYVAQYRVSYSLDGQRWTVYKENGTERVIQYMYMCQLWSYYFIEWIDSGPPWILPPQPSRRIISWRPDDHW